MFDKATAFLKLIQLKNRQRAIHKKFKRDGLTDEVLMEQIELNRFRNENNIHDTSKRVYDEYVQ